MEIKTTQVRGWILNFIRRGLVFIGSTLSVLVLLVRLKVLFKALVQKTFKSTKSTLKEKHLKVLTSTNLVLF